MLKLHYSILFYNIQLQHLEIKGGVCHGQYPKVKVMFLCTVKPLNSGHPKSWTISVKLPPNKEHLLITEKFFKTLRCPLFRGFTVFLF